MTDMRSFKFQAAQGDILIQKIDALPEGVAAVAPAGEYVVVAHSETGHNHVLDRETVTMYRLPDDIYDCFLVVDAPTPLVHQRDFDTHEPILLKKGIYRARRQREYTPEGFRRVED